MRHIQRSLRLSSLAIFALAFVLVRAPASAQQNFSMTGKAATGSGAFVDLPAGGDALCPEVTGAIGFPTMVVQKKTGMLGTLTTLTGATMTPLNPGGCIPGGALRAGMTNANVVVNGTGGFTVPAGFFNQPFPGGPGGGTAADLRVTPVPNNKKVVQLATSFQFTGPQAAPFEIKNPVLPGAYAVWRRVKHNAWMTQTGRAGKDFTVCPGTNATMLQLCGNPPDATSPDAPYPSNGYFQAILKNFGGPGDGFGGTMGLVLTTSPSQDSSLIIKSLPGLPTMAVAVAIVGGMGSRAPGRGYAARDNDDLMMGPIYLMYVLTMPGKYGKVGMVTTKIATGMDGINMNFGFPFTTGSIIARATGSDVAGGIAGQTVTAMGFDTMMAATAKGVTRNIQLVAGGFAKSDIQGNNGTPNYTIMRLPEPGGAMQLVAGAVALLGIGVWGARRGRG